LRPLKPSVKASLEAATTKYQRQIDDAEGYLKGRGILRRTAERHRLGVVVDPYPGHEAYVGRLSIPNIGSQNDVRGMKFRIMDDSDEQKYLGPSMESRLFHTRAIVEAESWICLTEGEIDTIILDQCGLPSVGLAGANAWKPHYSRVFAGFDAVYLFADPDSAGKGLAKIVTRALEQANVVTLSADVNDTYLEWGQDGIYEALREAGWSDPS
jgi:5S rRNA maturation endonuclease (ribonuclease M5)